MEINLQSNTVVSKAGCACYSMGVQEENKPRRPSADIKYRPTYITMYICICIYTIYKPIDKYLRIDI
jgi:hypothetical protein